MGKILYFRFKNYRKHKGYRQHHQKIILTDFFQGTVGIVKSSAARSSFFFQELDVDSLNVFLVPQRLEKRVREAKCEDVL